MADRRKTKPRRWWLRVPKVGTAIGFTDRDHAERFVHFPADAELVYVQEIPITDLDK